MNKIIAIGGLKNSGKDTVTSMLAFLLNTPKIFHSYFCFKHLNKIFKHNKYQIVAFADPIKEMLACLLNVDRKMFESRDFKEHYCVYLPDLDIKHVCDACYVKDTLLDPKFVKLAKEWNSNLSKSYWLTIRQVMQLFGTEIMRNYIDDKIWINCILNRSSNKNIIISDLRFITEYEEVKKKNGITIYIDRGINPGLHKSEFEIQILANQNKFDFVVNNKNVTLSELFDIIKTQIYEKIK